MALFKILRGKRENLPEKKTDGYAYFCIDDGTFWIDYLDNNTVQRKQINAKEAEELTGMTISMVLSSSSTEIPTSKAVSDAVDGKVDKVTGKGLSTNDLTNTLKSNYDAAYTHSTIAHAPDNAERNTIVTIQKNGTALSPDSSRAINVTVPTKVSELTNDSGYLTSVPVTSVNSKTGAVTLSASDVGAAPNSHTHNYAGSSSAGGAATSANKVNKSMTVKLNGGTTEGTNQFTFDGSAAKSVNITPSGIGAAASSHTHDYLPLSGGTLTGNLTGRYITGTWLQTTSVGDKAGNFATIDGDGWVYYRTPTETRTDIGAAAASHTHNYLPLTGGTVTGTINYPNAQSVYDTEGTVIGTQFLLLDNAGEIVRTSVSDTSLIDELGAAAKNHKHAASDITSGTLPITRGGTGATTAAAALTSLGGVPKSGTSMSGPLIAQANTAYGAAQMRNVIISTADPTSSDGSNGDIWLKYEA